MNLKDVVVYQVYPKSFRDTNEDGLGDLRGVIEKLDYLKDLGVDYIWPNPFYLSPQRDNGYDIQDYYQIDPMYGTMEDVETLIYEAKQRGMGVMLDLAINHTSTQHKWFQHALAGDKKYKDYYIFRPGRENNTLPPTNWQSKFGGSSWEYVESLGEYYLHLFDKTQADLNWDNPEVRKELYDIVNFWIDKGIAGFRLDVINLISKPEFFEDDNIGDGRRFYTDGPNIHVYLKELNENTFGRHPRIITVGEMSSTSIEECIRYSDPQERELSMVFSFHHLKMDYKNQDKWSLMPVDFIALKESLSAWQIAMQENNGWNALFWCNHDQPRAVSRFGNDTKYLAESAKMLATIMHLMRGTPYIYQGEEIGMTNADFTSIDEYRDIETRNYYKILRNQGVPEKETMNIIAARSRDNARTPMQWDQSDYAGFGTTQPWLNVNQNYLDVNVQTNFENPDSIYYYYQKLIQLRKSSAVIQNGTYVAMFSDHPAVFAYERTYENDSIVVICNFYEDETSVSLDIDTSSYSIILSNYPAPVLNATLHLRAFEAVVLKRR